MERIWLLILVGCSILGVGFVSEVPVDAAEEVSSINTLRGDFWLPAVASSPSVAKDSPEEAAEAAIVEQIVDRFAVRHTALTARERRALAHTIVREARMHRLEPDLVMAVIEVESAGYHLAQSHVGALGLMQLLPSTAKELAGKIGIEWKGPDTLFDPTINVQLGTAYLRELADRYDGNVSTALAAYNWGPGRIDRRIRRGATVPSKYIEQVMSAADRYASIATPARS